MYVHKREKKKKTVFLSTHFVFKCLIPIYICYLFEFKYFNYVYKKTQNYFFQKKKKKKTLFSPPICICKVEFNQPSCWLYSMPNLLVF